jgi:alkylation response protein AidB-like acyl-CoA dehydrogenase
MASEVVAGVVDGDFRISPALLERADRYDQADLPFVGGAISGTKCFVDYAPCATHFLASALDDGALVLVLAEASPESVQVTMLDNISRLPQAHVTFSRTPARRVAGSEALHWLVRTNRALSAVQCLGNAQQALDMTVDYVKVREQFGQPIGAFQAVQHHCADMATMVEACRYLTYECLWRLDDGSLDERLLASAKNWAARTVTEVTMLAHELHGGIGVTEEFDLHFFTRRGKDRAVAWGSADETIRELAATIDQANHWH